MVCKDEEGYSDDYPVHHHEASMVDEVINIHSAVVASISCSISTCVLDAVSTYPKLVQGQVERIVSHRRCVPFQVLDGLMTEVLHPSIRRVRDVRQHVLEVGDVRGSRTDY